MALKIKTQTFLNKFDIGNLNSFILNYQKTNYLISVHHNLPIDSVYDWNNQKLNLNKTVYLQFKDYHLLD